MTDYILDTNALVALVSGSNEAFKKNYFMAKIQQANNIYTTSLNYYEFMRGVDAIKDQKALKLLKEHLTDSIRLITLISEKQVNKASEIYNKNKKRHTKKNSKIKPSDVDVIIAAIAICRNATVVTHDDDFSDIQGLVSENWESKK